VKDHYDVLIAGGRCAGSAAAIGLGRAGYRVLLVERQKMPSNTISTHVLWPDGVVALRDLGVLEEVLATGAPPVRHFRLCRGMDTIETTLTPYEGIDHFLCVRRHQLDGILFQKAANTPGVDVRDSTRLTDLTHDGERVTGGRIVSGGSSTAVSAELVVGADGHDSTVARIVGAVEEDVVEPGRYWYYGYFSGVREPEPLAMTESDTETDTVVSMATDGDLQMVIYGAFNEDYQEFRQNHRENYLNRIRAHPFIDRMLADGELVSPVYGYAGVRGYYRTTSGPGWVLVGDAAHQKDPIVARGINDALLGGADLVRELSSGISNAALERYGERLRERTWSTSQTARILTRPDRHMSADQAEVLARELVTPTGLARVLGLEYGGITSFDDLFMTIRDGVVEVPAER
jgi:menaquinone-9 beta-reductase